MTMIIWFCLRRGAEVKMYITVTELHIGFDKTPLPLIMLLQPKGVTIFRWFIQKSSICLRTGIVTPMVYFYIFINYAYSNFKRVNEIFI